MSAALSAEWRPPFAHRPGQTPRHDEAMFEPFKREIECTEWEHAASTVTWQVALGCLQEGFGWEAHELLEPIWMKCPPNSRERLLVMALIQLANARLKSLMGREGAAKRLHTIARTHWDDAFSQRPTAIFGLGEQQVNAI